MEAEDRQLRILAFVERYQQQNQDAPTIREIVRATGVSYADIGGDIDAMVSKRILAYVTEHVTGSEPFSSRQVKAVAAPGATTARHAPSAPAPPGSVPPGVSRRAPAQHFGGQRGTGRRKAPAQQPLDPASTAGGHGAAPSRKPFRKRRKPLAGRSGASPQNRKARSAGPGGSRPGAGLVLRWRAALIGAIVGTLLFILAYVEEAGLLTDPIVDFGPLRFSAIVPAVVLALALQGFLVGRDIEINGRWSRRGLGRVLLLGLFAGTLLMAWSGLQPQPEWFRRTGIPRIVEGVALSLPVLLPFAISRRNGAALLGLCAALPPTLINAAPSHYSTQLMGVLLAPLLVELLIARRRDRGRGILMAAGALAGIGQTAAAYLTSPGALQISSWPAALFVSTATGVAAGWSIHALRNEAQARRASRAKGRRP